MESSLGNLFFELNLKDNVSSQLEGIKKSLQIALDKGAFIEIDKAGLSKEGAKALEESIRSTVKGLKESTNVMANEEVLKSSIRRILSSESYTLQINAVDSRLVESLRKEFSSLNNITANLPDDFVESLSQKYAHLGASISAVRREYESFKAVNESAASSAKDINTDATVRVVGKLDIEETRKSIQYALEQMYGLSVKVGVYPVASEELKSQQTENAITEEQKSVEDIVEAKKEELEVQKKITEELKKAKDLLSGNDDRSSSSSKMNKFLDDVSRTARSKVDTSGNGFTEELRAAYSQLNDFAERIKDPEQRGTLESLEREYDEIKFRIEEAEKAQNRYNNAIEEASKGKSLNTESQTVTYKSLNEEVASLMDIPIEESTKKLQKLEERVAELKKALSNIHISEENKASSPAYQSILADLKNTETLAKKAKEELDRLSEAKNAALRGVEQKVVFDNNSNVGMTKEDLSDYKRMYEELIIEQEKASKAAKELADKNRMILRRNQEARERYSKASDYLFEKTTIANQGSRYLTMTMETALNELKKFRDGLSNPFDTRSAKDIANEFVNIKNAILLARAEQVKYNQTGKDVEANYYQLEKAIRSLLNRKSELENFKGLKGNFYNEAIRQIDEYIKKLEELRGRSDKMAIKRAVTIDFRQAIEDIEKLINKQERFNMINTVSRSAQPDTIRNIMNDLRSGKNLEEELASLTGKSNKSLLSQIDIIGEVKNQLLDYLSIYAVERFVSSLAKVHGEFEKQRIALASIIGDVGKAKSIFDQLKTLSVKSPFQFSELTGFVKQLSAFSIPTDELFETTKRLADISAGLGVDMGRIILAYGQVRSASFLRGQEVRQFTEAGIPLLDELAKKFTELKGRVVDTGEVFDMISNREVPFEMVKQVLFDLTNEGGKFYQMQEVLADSLAGKISNLTDAYEIMLDKIGQGYAGDLLSFGVDGLKEAISNFRILGTALIGVASGYGAVRLASSLYSKTMPAMASNTKRNALELKREAAERIFKKSLIEDLNYEEKELLRTRSRLTSQDYKALAATGQVTKAQLLQLVTDKKLTASTAMRAAAVLNITKDELRAAAATNVFSMSWKKAKAVLISVGHTVKSLGMSLYASLINPGTLLFTLVASFTSIYSHFKNKEREFNDAIKATSDYALEKLNSINDFINKMNGKSITINADVISNINPDALTPEEMSVENKKMMDELKDKSPRFAEIKAEADSIGDLGDKYKYLVGQVNSLREAYRLMYENASSMNMAVKENESFFDPSLNGMMEEYSDYLKKQNEVFSKLSNYGSVVKKVISEIAAASSSNLKNEIIGKNLKEQLDIIYNGKYEDELSMMFSKMYLLKTSKDKIEREAGNVFDDYKFSRKKTSKYLNEKLIKEAQDVMDSYFLKNDIDVAHPENVSEAQKDAMRMHIEQYVNELENVSQEAKFKLIDIMLEYKINLKPIGEVESGREVALGYFGKLIKSEGEKLLGRLEYSKIDFGKIFTNDELSKIFDAKQFVEAINQKVKEYEEAYNYLSSLKVLDSDKEAEKYEKENYLKFIKSLQEVLINDELLKKATNGKDDKDYFAEKQQKRLDLLRQYNEEYKKYKALVGRGEATITVRGDERFKDIMNVDPAEIKDELKKIYDSLDPSMEQQKKIRDSISAMFSSINLEEIQESTRKAMDAIKDEIDKSAKGWSIYDKWFKATGDRNLSISMGFGGFVQDASYLDELKRKLKKELEGVVDDKGNTMTYDQVMKMTESELKKLPENTSIPQYVKAIVDETNKLKEENANTLLEILKNNRTFDQQLDDLRREREEKIRVINGNSYLTPDQKDQAIAGVDKVFNNKRSKIEFEKFKESTNWVAIFDDLNRVSTSTLNNMITSVEAYSKKTGESVDVVKTLIDALIKLRDESIERNPIKGIADSIKRIKNINKFEKDLDSDLLYKHKYNQKTGKIEKIPYTKEEKEEKKKNSRDAKLAAYTELEKAISKTIDGFDILVNVTDQISSMFEALGERGLSDITNIISGGLSGSVSMGENFKKTSSLLGFSDILTKQMGFIGMGIGAATSVIGGIAELHDKKLDIAINKSKERLDALKSAYDQINESIERGVGGLQRSLSLYEKLNEQALRANSSLSDSYKAQFEVLKYGAKGYVDKISNEINRLRKEEIILNEVGLGKYASATKLNWSYYEEMYKDLNSAGVGINKLSNEELKQREAQYIGLIEQRREVQEQLRLEEEKKKTDNGKVSDYQNQIAELNSQISVFVEDLTKELYGIDFEDWSSQISDALMNAFANGEDAAKAFKDTTNNIMKGVANNILKNLVIQPMFEKLQKKLFGDDKEKGIFETFEDIQNNGTLLAESLKDFFDNEGGKMISASEDFLEAFNKATGGAITTTGEKENEGLSKGISSVTEDTADLLASYLNAIRADVSIKRQLLQEFYLKTMPDVTRTLGSQLAELKRIEANTLSTANNTDVISEKMSDTYLLIKKATTPGSGVKLNI